MINTTLRIVRSRSVRDIYRNRKYVVEARFPGGRTIVKAKTATKERAFRAALVAAAPQTSPTAAGGAGSYSSDPEAALGAYAKSGGSWKFAEEDIRISI